MSVSQSNEHIELTEKPPRPEETPSTLSEDTPPRSSNPDIAPLNTIRGYFPFSFRTADQQINHLSNVLSTSRGIDSTLSTLCYTSLFTSSILTSITLNRLRTFSADLTKAIYPSTRANINATFLVHVSSLPSPTLLTTSHRLKAFSALLSDVRIFLRLWGLLEIYRWAREIITSPPSDNVLRATAYAQIAVNVLFQYLENVAYLSSKRVWGWSEKKQAQAYRWSSRFLMCHVFLEFVRLGWVVKKRVQWEKEGNGKGKEKGKELLEVEGLGETVVWWGRWRRDLFVNAACAPLTVHWGVERGIVSDFWLGLFGSFASVVSLSEVWRNSALGVHR